MNTCPPPTPTPTRLARVSAWITHTEIDTEKEARSVSARARALGLDGLDLMLGPQPPLATLEVAFRDLVKLERAMRIFEDDGLHVGVTTWCAPTEEWMDGLKRVGELAERRKVPVCLDAEESWIIPLKNKGQKTAAEWAAKAHDALRSTTCQSLEATHIVYGNQDVLKHLLQVVDVSIPQAYATAKNWRTKPPGSLERIAVNRWTDPRGRWRLELGQAAWDLVGAYGAPTAERALELSLQATISAGITHVRYWQWATLANLSSRCHAVIRRYRHTLGAQS